MHHAWQQDPLEEQGQAPKRIWGTVPGYQVGFVFRCGFQLASYAIQPYIQLFKARVLAADEITNNWPPALTETHVVQRMHNVQMHSDCTLIIMNLLPSLDCCWLTKCVKIFIIEAAAIHQLVARCSKTLLKKHCADGDKQSSNVIWGATLFCVHYYQGRASSERWWVIISPRLHQVTTAWRTCNCRMAALMLEIKTSGASEGNAKLKK